MRTQTEKARIFRALHERPGVFIMPNPWDAGRHDAVLLRPFDQPLFAVCALIKIDAWVLSLRRIDQSRQE